jgi:hypothetical protein
MVLVTRTSLEEKGGMSENLLRPHFVFAYRFEVVCLEVLFRDFGIGSEVLAPCIVPGEGF